jgi:outer membrane protease
LVLVFLFFAPLIFADEGKDRIGITLDTGTGITAGKVIEYVYEGEKQISRLEWEEYLAPLITLDARFTFRNFFVKTAVLTAFPVRTGFMRDYDYLLTDSAEATNYSEHDANLERHISADAALGYSFNVKNISLSPSAGFFYTNRKWSAVDGFLQYATDKPLQGDEEKLSVVGANITYEQKISYLYISLGVGYRFLKRFYISADGSLFPYLWIETMDYHILRGREFYDTMRGGIGGSAGLTLRYTPFEKSGLSLLAGFEWEKIPRLKGESASRTTGTQQTSAFVTGTEGSAFESDIWYIFLGVGFKVL